jgi:hypothetical protein
MADEPVILGDNCFRLIGETEPLLNGLEFGGTERRLAAAEALVHVEKGLPNCCCCRAEGEPKCWRFVSELLGLNEGDRSDQKEPQVAEELDPAALPGGFR